MVFGPLRSQLGWLSQPYKPSPNESASREVCQFFTKSGWCKFGEECRFEHVHGPDTPVAPMGGVPTAEKSGEVCQFFAKSGWCKYGDHCKYGHIGAATDAVPRETCNFFTKSGWCQWGDSCKYEHVQGQDVQFAPPKFDELDKLDKLDQLGGEECCQFYSKTGWCKFGDNCRFQHSFDAAQAPIPEKSGEICQFFAKSGWCKYADQCKHEHVGEPRDNVSATGTIEACQFFAKSGWCQYGNGCKYSHSGPGLAESNGARSPRADKMHIGTVGSTSNIQGIALSATQAESAATALLQTRGMQKAESMGLDLSEEAVRALLTLPSTHASELLEAVADKQETLRDPSNYVVSTIARGYVSRGF
mmetsp:Transcript_84336/g.103345  ORF Transcript_84336/g.103345 Transcript_84336/m.103345 type:complete len:360 (+) Transcript_84336:83-1162(+)